MFVTGEKKGTSQEKVFSCRIIIVLVTTLQSMDTSMGFTPLAGLMMGTRCGSVDPSLVGFACETMNKTVEEVMDDFNKGSGLKGMVGDGESYDMRALLQRQGVDPQAALAIDMFVYRLAQYIAAAMVALKGPLDALIFTAGIGEHAAEIRRRTMEQLKTSLEVNQAMVEASGHQVEQAQAALKDARSALSKTTLYAPMTGRVTRLNSSVFTVSRFSFTSFAN